MAAKVGKRAVIEPEYLAQLRRKYCARTLMLMVQLEQRAPEWWPNLGIMAGQFGCDRSAMNVCLIKLDKLGLVGRYSSPGNGGTWVWWVKRSRTDKCPPPPSWKIVDIHTGSVNLIRVDQHKEWAEANRIPARTVRDFLDGNIKIMRGRWRLVSTPFDRSDVG
jgi:hypothetical protein